MPTREVANWKLVERYCVSGHSFGQAARKFKLKEDTIKKRAKREDWPTRGRAMSILRRSEKASKGASSSLIVPKTNGAQSLADELKALGEGSNLSVARMTHDSLKKFAKKAPRIMEWSEANTAYNMLRKSTGQETANGVNIQLNMGGVFTPQKAGDDGPVVDCREV